jgi:hypothetical protein
MNALPDEPDEPDETDAWLIEAESSVIMALNSPAAHPSSPPTSNVEKHLS